MPVSWFHRWRPFASRRTPDAVFLTAALLMAAALLLGSAGAQTLELRDGATSYPGLTNTVARLAGRAELRLTGPGDPLPGSTVHLDGPDAWLWLDQVSASQASATMVPRLRIDGAQASPGTNVRIVQAGRGAVIVPHRPSQPALEIFAGRQFTGASRVLEAHQNHLPALPPSSAITNPIGSLRLKRGYVATLAADPDGGGASRCLVAQDGDLELGRLPATLENNVRFIRVFPWRWTGKKGVAGDIESGLAVDWTYNWNLNRASTADWEYVPIRQTRYWPPLSQDWNARGATHLLGFNEPDRPDQANLTVAEALASWPDLLATGLRVGAPAVSDGGLSWLYDFMSQADAAGLRVDFVPVHYYRCFGNAADPAGAANQFYNFLKGIHDVVQRPLWITEWNNGANWTTCADPTPSQQAATIAAILDMLDSTPFVERYAIYNWVEDVRRVKWDDGSLTAAGVVYRDQTAPVAHRQELPDTGIGTSARFSFDGHAQDMTDSAHPSLIVGQPRFVSGRHGQAIALNGRTDYVQISPRIGDNTDWSFAGWVYWNGGDAWQRIFDLGQDTGRYLFLSPRSSGGQLRFAINAGNGEQQLSGPALPTGQWVHLAVTLSGSTGKLFVNGLPIATNTAMTINPADVGTRFNYLGKSRFSADPLFNGRLDDLRFLSSALSEAQVAALVSNPPPLFRTSPLLLPPASPGQPYTASLSGEVSGTPPLTFTKVAGPAWLNVAANGAVSGLPDAQPAHAGELDALVRVTDASGSMHTAVLRVPVPLATIAIAAGFDDAEQAASGAVNLSSTDLELIRDTEGGAGDQIVGLRFSGIPIPAGALVTNAFLQFTADESQAEPATLEIHAEAADHAAPFAAAPNQIGARPRVAFSVPWTPAPWAAGQSNEVQRSPNLAALVQEIVARPGWQRGQALALFLTGSGHRTAEAFDKPGGQPARLTLAWIPPTPAPASTFTAAVTGGANDAEESSTGTVTLNSTDLELVDDPATSPGPQIVALRFGPLPVPAGAILESAQVRFTADEAQADPTDLLVRAEAVDDATPFTANARHLSTRTTTSAAVRWTPPAWSTPGEQTSLQSTPDLAAPLAEVFARPGWRAGQSVALLISGTGHRTADAADKAGGTPAELSLAWRLEPALGTLARWMRDHPDAGPPHHDLDGDGYDTLMEYALGLNPTMPESGALVLRTTGPQLALTFTRPVHSLDLDLAVEWRDLLGFGAWTSSGVTVRVVADDGQRRTFEALIPPGALGANTAGQRFVRLRVSMKP